MHQPGHQRVLPNDLRRPWIEVFGRRAARTDLRSAADGRFAVVPAPAHSQEEVRAVPSDWAADPIDFAEPSESARVAPRHSAVAAAAAGTAAGFASQATTLWWPCQQAYMRAVVPSEVPMSTGTP